jgi:hypothetical protein
MKAQSRDIPSSKYFLPKLLFFALMIFAGPILISCSDGSSDSGGSNGPDDSPDLPIFINVIGDAGIGDIGSLGQTAAWGDFNSDGCQDLFVANTDFVTPNVFLFENNCDGTFRNVTSESGISDIPLRSAAWADFDNDGRLDLIVGTIMVSAPPILYKNLDGSTFLDVSRDRGLTLEGSTVKTIVWADYDLDGFVDFFQAGTGKSFLYHNEGDGSFREVSEQSGVGPISSADSALWFDFNNDGFPELFVAKTTPGFYLNNGDGSFTEIAAQAGLLGAENGSPLVACAADYNRDGNIDLYLGNIGIGNTLYRNNGDGTFSDVTMATGTSDVGDARTCAWVDIDGDGWIDIVSTNHFSPTRVFRNLSGVAFVDVVSELGVEFPIDVFAASWGDFNRDGFMDGLFTGHIGNVLLQNGGTSSNFLIFELVGNGVSSNVSAIGARVSISSSSGVQVREVSGGKGCCEQDMLPVHFGLGNDRLVDVVVDWPGGGDCFFTDVDVDGGRIYTIFQDGCDIVAR